MMHAVGLLEVHIACLQRMGELCWPITRQSLQSTEVVLHAMGLYKVNTALQGWAEPARLQQVVQQ